MSLYEIADTLDELANDLRATTREPTTGATQSAVFGDLARLLIVRAARLRAAAETVEFSDAQHRAKAQAIAELAGPYDPAEHTGAEVNAHLRTADAAETARVLALEADDRPDVPDGRKQRSTILSGPHAAYQ